jgi:hypothetical protein
MILNFEQNPDISLGTDVCRAVKRDVLKIVRGPSAIGQPKNGFLLAALSHLKVILTHCILEMKGEKKKKEKSKSKKGEAGNDVSTSLPVPPWKTQILAGKISPVLEVNKVKLAAKKIDFYLSWVSERYAEYELFYK